MTAESSQKLADALRAAGLTELAGKAENDDFHDFLSRVHNTPTIALANALFVAAETASLQGNLVQAAAAMNLRERVMSGDFDASKAEADEWANSSEGKAMFKKVLRG